MLRGQKLKDLIDKLSKSINQFEQEIGVERTRIEKIITRNSKVASDVVSKIVGAFPTVNKDWLLTGEGQMFNNQGVEGDNKNKSEDSTDIIDRDDIKSLIQAAKDGAAAAKSAAEAASISARAALVQARNNERLTLMVNAGYKAVPEVSSVDENAGHDEELTNYQVLKQYAVSQAMLSRGIDLETALREFDTIEHVFHDQLRKMGKLYADNPAGS